jgi:hypothetical protein
MSINVELINNSNDWNKWIEEAISRKLIKYYEFKQFHNVQEIGSEKFIAQTGRILINVM